MTSAETSIRVQGVQAWDWSHFYMSKVVRRAKNKWKTYGHFRDKNPHVVDPQAEPDTVNSEESPYQPVELPVQLLALMEECLLGMSQRQRSCMELFYGVGGKGRLSQKQIADELMIPKELVSTLVRNGLKRMRQFLMEHGYQG